jgi:hypothetical protein
MPPASFQPSSQSTPAEYDQPSPDSGQWFSSPRSRTPGPEDDPHSAAIVRRSRRLAPALPDRLETLKRIICIVQWLQGNIFGPAHSSFAVRPQRRRINGHDPDQATLISDSGSAG